MINLLSKENKIIAKREYVRRLFVVVGFALFFDLFVALVLTVPVYYSLRLQNDSLQQQLEFSNQLLVKEGITEIDSFIKETNHQVSILKNNQKIDEQKSFIIEKILDIKNGGVWIDGFVFTNKLVTINGESDTRQNLLNFISLLEEEDVFKVVNSPWTNLLKDRNIDFNINIQL